MICSIILLTMSFLPGGPALVAESFLLEKESITGVPILESMHIDYLGAATRNTTVELECQLLSPEDSRPPAPDISGPSSQVESVKVRVLLKQGTRVRSDGILTWMLRPALL